MNQEQILNMLKDLVTEIDYDLYKEMFLEGYGDEGDQTFHQQKLVNVVKEHLEKAKIPDPTSLEARIDRFLDEKLPKENS